MELIVLIIFISVVSWFYAKTGGYHNYLIDKEENRQQIEEEEKELFDSLPPDFFEKYGEYVDKEKAGEKKPASSEED